MRQADGQSIAHSKTLGLGVRSATLLSIAALSIGVGAAPALAAGHHAESHHGKKVHQSKKVHHGKKVHQAKKPTAPAQAAVIYPLLQFFQFGNDIGVPIVCGTGSSLLGSGAAYFGDPSLTNPEINAVNTGCNAVVAQGDKYIDLGLKFQSDAAAINPYVNPVIASTGTSVSDFGTQYGTALNPLGPTIAGAGATIDFFEGSGS